MYSTLRKILFLRDPESAHESALRSLTLLQSCPTGRAILRRTAGNVPDAPCELMGLRFRHRIGLAAGFDKDARCVLALQELGFAFVEVGTVTPRPQPGNPRPRLWRFPEAEALVNAMGFPGEGMERVGVRLRRLRESGKLRIPIGINLGKNADTPPEEITSDYLKVFRHLDELGDYFVVNVSSPNTAGLRDLQAVERLRPLLEALTEMNAWRLKKPLLVKIAPDLADDDAAAVGRLVRDLKLAGIVAGNTTIRRDLVSRAASLDRGGLSGAPQFPRTLQVLAILRGQLTDRQVLIAAGGISAAERVQQCLRLGANLVQVYTPFIYLGPRCVSKLLA
ncbi:quinone-dependent dihydroorotate dehydrogenase [bacterium]|nr:quinone-dependent dihydroorotate dehydrogenase [bacterium]MBU1983616.1 quinone-dependent dihydroorotate dehydrogenase [bacterium]